MIQDFVEKIINTIPKALASQLISTPMDIDVVLEGGAFNGSYLAGCLIYLKEFENRKYIKIHRLSACSVGTLISLVYFINDESLMSKIYNIAYNQFKKKADINIFKKAFPLIRKYINENIFSKINNKLYISYFNIKTGRQKVISKYRNIEHLLDVIRRSCSFPYIIDKNLYYKNKYVDGMFPYTFYPKEPRRTLYLNLHSIQHMSGLISVKNEESNLKRVLDGMMSIHTFFVYKQKTDICSFVNEWTYIEYFKHYLFITSLMIFAYILHNIYIIQQIIQKKIKNDITVENIINYTYNLFIKKYCV